MPRGCSRTTSLRPIRNGTFEEPAMPLQALNVCRILQHDIAKQSEQTRRGYALRIQRVECGTGHLARPVGIAMEPSFVEPNRFPAEVNGRPHALVLVRV